MSNKRFILFWAILIGQLICIASAQNQHPEALQTDSLVIDDALPQYEHKSPAFHVIDEDSLLRAFDAERAWEANTWTPDSDPYFANYEPVPAKAVWYAALFPGGGQIYNRKYWKLPIIYGGYLGLIYGYRWNQKYYRTYANAYRDLMLDSPNASYRDFLPPNYDVNARRSYLEKTFRRKRNAYRNYRDYCVVGMIGVYLVAMVDAYVDASLYHFDVSTNLDANNRPTLMVGYHIDF
ncbi:MAG: hypothetical protein IJP70_03290 [Bacteroidales bacterium]|nr:hypothetical protein [Bacteroidales bacterium]